ACHRSSECGDRKEFVLGLPDGIQACLFDLDGVLTNTAAVHAAAWREMFDDYLRKAADTTGARFTPFDIHGDYDEYVDGKPRPDGVRDFLASRGITLPEGTPGDPPAADTFLDAASQLGVDAAHAAVFEDALSGVAAGHAGHFGYVVGVDRVGQARALAEHGASRVVTDLADLLDDQEGAS